jgi:outer membrane receptor for ferrienterochelin and colicin
VVQGAFTGGGSSAGTSNDVQNHIEVQNYTSIALKKNFIRLGGRLRTTSDNNTTTAGQNGTFTYASMADYVSGVPNCPYTAGSPQCTGLVTQYSITHIAVPTISERSTDVGLYAETDWKVRPNLTFSYGLRFETQNYIHDHADFAPRTSLAYGISKKTVLRAGAGRPFR